MTSLWPPNYHLRLLERVRLIDGFASIKNLLQLEQEVHRAVLLGESNDPTAPTTPLPSNSSCKQSLYVAYRRREERVLDSSLEREKKSCIRAPVGGPVTLKGRLCIQAESETRVAPRGLSSSPPLPPPPLVCMLSHAAQFA